MASSLDGKLVVAISSRALFDFEEENHVFEQGDDRAYMQLQLARLDEPAKPGVAFSLVKKLLAQQEQQEQNQSDKDDNKNPQEQSDDQQDKKPGDQADDQQRGEPQSSDAQADEQGQDQGQENAAENNPQQDGEQQEAQAKEPSDTEADPMDAEERQALENWLRKVSDDPGGLLRRKFEMQYTERLKQGRSNNNGNQSNW